MHVCNMQMYAHTEKEQKTTLERVDGVLRGHDRVVKAANLCQDY